MNPQNSSRPFLRLFSQAQQAEQADPGSQRRIEQSASAEAVRPPKRVDVALAQIAPLLADAVNHRRGWLKDFAQDTVSIDADLYEVLLAYQQLNRPRAA